MLLRKNLSFAKYILILFQTIKTTAVVFQRKLINPSNISGVCNSSSLLQNNNKNNYQFEKNLAHKVR